MDLLRRYSVHSSSYWLGIVALAMVISNLKKGSFSEGTSALKDVCVVLKGALTNVEKTAEWNRERLRFLEDRGRWFYVGGDIELKKVDKEKLKPMGYDWVMPTMDYVKKNINVEEVLRRAYGRWKIKFEKIVVIPEAQYQQLWNETHSNRYESCSERIEGDK